MAWTEDVEGVALTAANHQALRRFAWIFGSGLALSLIAPDLLFPAMISSFTGLSAGVLATIALFARDNVFAPHLSRWDIAAALYAVSLFSGLFVDLEAINVHLMVEQSPLH
jgi:hypothetical protein